MDITDKQHQPTIPELSAFIANPLFDTMYSYLLNNYQPSVQIAYSGDNVLLGWNIKFKKGGRTLCTVYPRPHHFFLLRITLPKRAWDSDGCYWTCNKKMYSIRMHCVSFKYAAKADNSS